MTYPLSGSMMRRVAVAALAGSLALAAPVMAQAPEGKPMGHHMKKGRHMMGRLSVTGEGVARAVPDMATITIGVSSRADSAAGAMTRNATEQQAVIDQLKAESVEDRDIQTSGLNLSPVMDHSQDAQPPKVVGYQAQNMVTVRVRDLDRLGAMLDGLVNAGANEIYGIAFGLQDPQAAEDEARRAAVAEARRRAEIMAEAAGVHLGPILFISDSQPSMGPQPQFLAMADAAMGAPVERGEMSVSQQATLTFAIRAAPGDVPGEQRSPETDSPADGAEAPASN